MIQESWETFGSKPDSVSVPRGTLQVCFIHKFLTCNGLISCCFYCAKMQFGILGELVLISARQDDFHKVFSQYNGEIDVLLLGYLFA